MGIFLGIASQKGGVGKTTMAVNIGYSLVRRGWRVLLVDADLQGGLGFSLNEKAKDCYGLFDILMNPGWEQSIAQFPIRTCMNQMELITRGTRENLDKVLSDMDGTWSSHARMKICRSAIESLGHDVIIFDTSSGISKVGMSVCAAMDMILVPEHPGPLCIRSLPQMLRMLASAKHQGGNAKPDIAGFVFSMTDAYDQVSLEDQRQFRELLPQELVFNTVVPKHSDVMEATRIGVPVGMLDQQPGGPALAFDQLSAELEPKLGLGSRGQYGRNY
ncbi:MAG: ParA family protein [Verrucomicrobiales bacterium]|nr:ParA family protein [Verrucomicrobiales bacterium]